ncbi:MAG TPA: type I methionyl aminopeptidase, partial [Dongiaceae bacterium]|nr:type I methionyl aminopeptidase [Dongiaceae bacterium]
YPKSICTSVNHVVCHGIPNDKKVLKKGDIVNIDITVFKNGVHGDTSKMFVVGEASIQAERLIRVTQECLYLGIKMVKPGVRLGDIGHAIQQHAEGNHFSVVREYCGHGIGEIFHEEPQVLHYGRPNTGVALQAGMIFTIEPMINAGKRFTKLLPDQWTVVTKDHKLSAQWEHTILVTDTGFDVLTLRKEEAGVFGSV